MSVGAGALVVVIAVVLAEAIGVLALVTNGVDPAAVVVSPPAEGSAPARPGSFLNAALNPKNASGGTTRTMPISTSTRLRDLLWVVPPRTMPDSVDEPMAALALALIVGAIGSVIVSDGGAPLLFRLLPPVLMRGASRDFGASPLMARERSAASSFADE